MKKVQFKGASILVAVAFIFLGGAAFCAEEDHAHEHGEEHDHSEFKYLYGNHFCPVCDFADAVDPHYFAVVKNKKQNVYSRIYVCEPACAKAIEDKMAEFYFLTYRTDRKTGEEIPPRDLKNEVCPVTEQPVDGKTKIEYNGLIVHFSSPDSVEKFLAEPEEGLRKILPEAKEFKFEEAEEGHEGHDHGDDHDHADEVGHDHDKK